MQVQAPAKINLSFRIKGRREDGFHEIETLMAPVTLTDRLTIVRDTSGGGIDFSCDDPSLPPGGDNLVVKAASLFRETANVSDGVKIALEKRIPHGAGLGGGSSDAASTLLGLNELFETRLASKTLLELAAKTGSDVPFFIARSSAVCRGRGELVEPLKLSPGFRLLLLKPEFGVPTPWAYGKWKESRELPGIHYGEQEFGGRRFVNDLERPVFEKYLVLGHLKMWLREQPEVGVALLSGSGSTVFAVLRDEADGEALAARVREKIDSQIWTHVCETQAA